MTCMLPRDGNWIAKILRRAASSALGLAILLPPAVVAPQPAQAQTFTTLYSFKGPPDGYLPFAGVIRDRSGNLYGTTSQGGAPPPNSGCTGCGIIYKLDTSGNETVLYSFTAGEDGGYPSAELVGDWRGNLYGTTPSSGEFCHCGAVFKLNAAGKVGVLHTFTGVDGGNPSGVIRDTEGNLYGTSTKSAWVYRSAVFKLDATGNQTVLYSFTGGTDGADPSGVIRDAAGNLYGTTYAGGDWGCLCGTVFKLDTTGTETVLHTFTGDDGKNPYAGVIRDAAGNLYGTTLYGGFGYGIVFKLDSSGNETVLHKFTGGADGSFPPGGLVQDGVGNLYGTTKAGGTGGRGTVFKLSATGRFGVLYTFTGGADGGGPNGHLIRDAKGNLYGTTGSGGISNYGTVFKITR